MQRGRKNFPAINAVARAWSLLDEPCDPHREYGEPANSAKAALASLERAMIAILDENQIRAESVIASNRIKQMLINSRKKATVGAGMG